MPVTVRKHISGHNEASSVLREVQALWSQPVAVSGLDTPQALERQIIIMQAYLVTQGKFSAGNVCKSIDHQQLGNKLVELQVAANS